MGYAPSFSLCSALVPAIPGMLNTGHETGEKCLEMRQRHGLRKEMTKEEEKKRERLSQIMWRGQTGTA